MRQRSKSCFVSPDEVRKLNDEDNKETNDIISVDTFDNVITQIISQIPQNDEEPFEERLEKIKWKKIQINQHPYKKIKELVHSAIEKVRKHRILLEVLEDAKLAFKTQNSKVDDIKTVINKFHLDEPKKKKETVRTPFFDYYDEIKSNGVKYNEARSKYKNMEDSEKLKWILKFLEVIPGQKLNLEQYKKAKDVLNQQEMKIIDEYEEKPKKMTPYNYFIKNYFKDMKNRGTELNGAMILKHAVEAWKQLPEYEKQKYQEQAGQLKIQYDEDLKHFIDTLPQDRKDEVITERKRKKKANIKEDNKKQKTLDNYIIDEAGADVKKDTTPQKTTSTKHKTLKSKLITSETDKGNRKEKSAIKKSEVKNNSKDKNFLNNNAADVKNSSSTKKNKKKKEENLINFEEEETVQKPSFNLKKPPESLYKFYALNVFSGPKASAKYNYKRLTKEERKQLVEKHKKAEEKFLKKFKKYLNTLSVEEMQNIQAKINLEDEDISDITESSDWSEESIE